MPLPDAIREAPELIPGVELFYSGFLDLTSCRQIGMGPGPISLLSMLEYCFIHGIEGDQRDHFLWIIQRLDQKYLEWSRQSVSKSK